MRPHLKNGTEAILCRGLFCLQRLKLWLLFFWTIWMIDPDRFAMADPLSEGGGPLTTRNYSPVQLLFLSLPAEKATTLSRGAYEISLEMVESATVLAETTPQFDALLKFETFRSALHMKYGLTNRLEVGLEIPFLYRDGGFLDPFITSVEDAFDNANPDRVRFADGRFGGYTVKLNGRTILSGGDNQTGLGDVVLSGKAMVLQESSRRPAIALRGAIKFPTGDFDRAFGSGKPDFGSGLALQKTIASRWIFYLNQNVVFPTGHFGTTDLGLTPFFTTATALEYLWTPRFSIVGQFDYYTTPFRDTGTQLLDNGVAETVLGFHYKINSNVLWQLYGIENLQNPQGAAADFTLGTKFSVRF